MYISKGNHKMQAGFLIWNLPAQKTCIGSTEFCRKHCYAQKAERQYPAVIPSRQGNLDASKGKDFAREMIELITKTAKGFKKFNGRFRIHEAGDFYNQKYLNAWKEIARALPDIDFLAFTKSFKLDFSGAPRNLKVLMSIMPDTKAVPPKGFPLAYAGDCKRMRHAVECAGSCDHCTVCWTLPLTATARNVHFKIH